MKQLKAGGVVNIRHRITGEILLSISGNSLIGADLNDANLQSADLNGVNLTGASLNGADLNGADLMCSDLTEADLNGANLNGANLTGADLTGVNLTRANLIGANLRKSDLRVAMLPKDITFIKGLRWDVTILEGFISIGCKTYAIEEWEKFTDEEISKMGDDALEFWTRYKCVILEKAKDMVK